MKIKEQREEIMLCLIEQGYFDFKIYEKEMEKLEQVKDLPCIYKEILKDTIHKIIRNKIDNIINSQSNEETKK